MIFCEQDLVCLKSPEFLKNIYKVNISLFSEFLVVLSKNDEVFTNQSCYELTKLVASRYNEREILNIYKAVNSILLLKDSYQKIRFEILLGIEQLTFTDSNYKYNFPSFGFHNLKNHFEPHIEYRGTMANDESCCFLKKILNLRGQPSLVCELFLLMLETASNSPELLKYLVCCLSQEPCNKE